MATFAESPPPHGDTIVRCCDLIRAQEGYWYPRRLVRHRTVSQRHRISLSRETLWTLATEWGWREPVSDNFLTGMMCAINANTSSACVVEPSRAIAAHFLGRARSSGRGPRLHAMS
jgi:hypothetical protein